MRFLALMTCAVVIATQPSIGDDRGQLKLAKPILCESDVDERVELAQKIKTFNYVHSARFQPTL
jgi:hypothetical protein